MKKLTFPIFMKRKHQKNFGANFCAACQWKYKMG